MKKADIIVKITDLSSTCLSQNQDYVDGYFGAVKDILTLLTDLPDENTDDNN